MNWEDLRYILAVSREGTMSAAAEALGVNITTVSRRLKALEEEIGTALFTKVKHGVAFTEAGDDMATVAESISRLTHDLDARISGRDTKAEGRIRVTSTELLLRHFVHDLAEFQAEHPAIELDLDPKTAIANLSEREADVALRLGQSAPPHLIGRAYGRIFHAVYGHRDLLDADSTYGEVPWVIYSESVSAHSREWVEQNAPGATIAMRVTTPQLMLEAIEQSIGVGMVPCFLGDTRPELMRVGDYLEPGLQIWLLTRPELRGAARVRELLRHLRAVLKRDLDLFEGRRPLSE